MSNLPTGTVTFLYTDIESSTQRWDKHPAAMKAAVERHDAILRACIDAHGGVVFRTMGDAFCASFQRASDALATTLDAQSALHDETWRSETGPLRVRMALHTGTGEVRDGDYVGHHLNRIARLLSTGYGGQILVSNATGELLRDALPPGITLRDLGEHRLKDLQRTERVFQVCAPDLPTDFPPLKTLENRPNNLPLQRSPLIGREKELGEVPPLLLRDDIGLVTFTGPGGTGKTRLALQVAAELIDQFEDGVYFVNLSNINDASLVASAIAEALSIRELGSQPIVGSVKDFLKARQLLLVLDNFEQVVEAAPLVAEILSVAPRLKVLATSRQALHLYGERDYPVPPLGLPSPNYLGTTEQLTQYDAVRLFIERARAVKPSFEVTNENAPAVAEICYRLDGLPLAIELAAARIAVLSPQAMLTRLQSRLKLLTGGARDLPARQQTLRGAIDWSYDSLDAEEQKLFRRLSVFVGGCTLEAAEAVCAGGTRNQEPGVREDMPELPPLDIDLLDGLSSLVAKSLVRQVDAEDKYLEGEPRFLILETIREYGLERLAESGELEAMQRNHAYFFCGLAEDAMPKFMGREAVRQVAQANRERDNFRAALTWAVAQGEAERALRLVGSLFYYWDTASLFNEGRRWTEEILARFGTDKHTSSPIKAQALYASGFFAFLQGDFAVARERLDESIAMWREVGDKSGLARALHPLGMTSWQQGDYMTARIHLEESTTLFRTLGEKQGLALALFSLGDTLLAHGDEIAAQRVLEESIRAFRDAGDDIMGTLPINSLGRVAWSQGDYDRARTLMEEALKIRQEYEITFLSAISLASLAEVARCQGRYDESMALSDESLALYKEVGDAAGIAWCRYNQGYTAYYLGDYPRSLEVLREGLSLRHEQGSKADVALCIAALASVAAKLHQRERAARLFGAADARFEAADARLSPADKQDYYQTRDGVLAHLGEATWEAAQQAGRNMSIEEAVSYALKEG
jgi:predicted ATPase/class 3 adenylate cyclase